MNHKRAFDLHCDTLTTAYKDGKNLVNPDLHFSLDRLPKGWRLCQCMAVFLPDNLRGQEAEDYFDEIYQYYQCQLEQHRALCSPVKSNRCIPSLLNQKPFALMLTVEGGAVLNGKLENLHKLHWCGVKMMTLTWNGPNEICGGAATPDQGFTPFGVQAVDLMERLGMVVDVSHLSDAGFWELCEFAKRPFVASHSNSRAICDHRRNLTDGMFREISGRGGLVGLNYYKDFIVKDGKTTVMNDLLRHVHHFLELGGEDTLALGSDFDGADLPAYLGGIQCVESLWEAMIQSGIQENVVDKIFFGNACRFFAETMTRPYEGC